MLNLLGVCVTWYLQFKESEFAYSHVITILFLIHWDLSCCSNGSDAAFTKSLPLLLPSLPRFIQTIEKWQNCPQRLWLPRWCSSTDTHSLKIIKINLKGKPNIQRLCWLENGHQKDVFLLQMHWKEKSEQSLRSQTVGTVSGSCAILPEAQTPNTSVDNVYEIRKFRLDYPSFISTNF